MESEKFEDQRLYRKAQKRVKEIRAFYYHLTCYLLTIPIIIVVNLMVSPWFLWCLFAVIGWGLGIVIHGVAVFKFLPFLGKDWEEKKLKEILEKEKEKKWQ